MPIEYEDNVVTSEHVAEARRKLDECEPGWAKYGRFKALLHYGEMHRWQRQGWHHAYGEGEGSHYCVCGLILYGEPKAKELVTGELPFELDEVQRVKGHLRLPFCQEKCVAILVGFDFNKEENDYFWNVYCQECMEWVAEASPEDGEEFLNEHNEKCGKK